MLERNLVGAACDTCCGLFDTQTSKQILSFPRQCQYFAFIPINNLLMCSVSGDKSICFYDIHDRKTIILKPRKNLNRLRFASTVTLLRWVLDYVMIYDLKKSTKKVVKWVQGHSEPVTALAWQFKGSKYISRTPA
jgi:WD40 repeat protein